MLVLGGRSNTLFIKQLAHNACFETGPTQPQKSNSVQRVTINIQSNSVKTNSTGQLVCVRYSSDIVITVKVYVVEQLFKPFVTDIFVITMNSL